jgi:hypothetical protein
MQALLQRLPQGLVGSWGTRQAQELRIDDVPDGDGHFAFGDVAKVTGHGSIKQFKGLLVLVAFRTPHAGPLNPPRRLSIAFIATQPIETHTVVARQAP